jgi:hypothetical protein
MSFRPRFFTFVLPILWGTIATFSFRYPGDEYGMFFVGSLSGLWVLWLFPRLHQGVSPDSIFPVVLLAGVATMAVLGYLLDLLRCSRVAFVIIWLAAAAILLAYVLGSYPSYEGALAKNGSPQAYVLFAANLSLLLASLLCLLITAGYVVGRRITGRPLH